MSNWIVINSDYLASGGNKIIVDNRNSDPTIYFPLKPQIFDEIMIIQIDGSREQNIKLNGQKYESSVVENLYIAREQEEIGLIFYNNIIGWKFSKNRNAISFGEPSQGGG